MPSNKSDHLVELITTLTKSEKRNFSLKAKQAGRSQLLYQALYEHVLKYESFDEAMILKRIPQIKKSQLSNLKANLYKQVLRSLRDIHKENYLEIKAREQFDFAKVLYAKGQYKSSLEMLEKVKKLARRIKKLPLEYLALSFEKHIESQHVTGSMSPKAIVLARESEHMIKKLGLTDSLANLSLLMYGKYLQLGVVRSERERQEVTAFINQHLPPAMKARELTFYQQLYLYQSYVWYHMMLQNFAKYYQYAKRWTELFGDNPEMRQIETVTYIKGMHNVLNALYLSDKPQRFEAELERFKQFNTDGSFDLSINERSQFQLFKYIHILNLVFFKANYHESLTDVHAISILLEEQPNIWDLNRRIVFHYKIACVYFGANDLDNTIIHLNAITNNHTPGLKEDIQCFARILKLITHFDIGDEDLVSYDVRSVFRFLLKMQELQAVQREILKFIRKTPAIKPTDIISEFESLRARLIPLEQDMLHRRPFLYLDIISWLDSKIKGISMAEAIRQRRGLA